MNTYDVYVYSQQNATQERVEAESSFLARKYLAQKHSVDGRLYCVTDIVARRFWKPGD